MSEIRSWAAGALAAAAVAVGVGAGLQIARTGEPVAPPVAPVVAVVATPSPSTRAAPLPPALTAARSTTALPTTALPATALPTTAGPTAPRTTRPTTTRPSTRPTSAAADEGLVIFGQTNAEAYRQCVRSPNSPGAAVCRRITDAGGRGE